MTDLDDLVDEWDLRPDGAPVQSPRAVVLPVRSSGAAAVLKMSTPDTDSDNAHLVLRRWGGDGAVRVLRADPHRRAVPLERLRPESLETLWDVEDCTIVAGLYRRLHVPSIP